MMLNTFEQCADQIEAAGKSMIGLSVQAEALRRGEINLLALSGIERDARRILEATKAINHLMAVEQGRAPAQP